jgi:hypothetical protein
MANLSRALLSHTNKGLVSLHLTEAAADESQAKVPKTECLEIANAVIVVRRVLAGTRGFGGFKTRVISSKENCFHKIRHVCQSS